MERICREALERAEELRREGKYREGIELLVEALKYGIEKPMIYFRLGNLYFDAGDLSRAEYAYKRAIEEDPKFASAYHNLGVVYRRQGKIGLSVKMLKKARRLELLYPRPKREELSMVEKRTLLRLGLYSMAFLLGLIALFIGILFLISFFLRG